MGWIENEKKKCRKADICINQLVRQWAQGYFVVVADYLAFVY